MSYAEVRIPDYVTMIEPACKLPVCELAGLTDELLTENRDLPAPRYFSASHAGQEIGLQFADSPDTFHAMAVWAERFGGTVIGEPHTDDGGRSSVRCQVNFTHRGVSVRLYAFVSATVAGMAT